MDLDDLDPPTSPEPPTKPPLGGVSKRLAQAAAVAAAVTVGVMGLLLFPRPHPAAQAPTPPRAAAQVAAAVPAAEPPAPAPRAAPALRPRIAPPAPPRRHAVTRAHAAQRPAPARPVIVEARRRPGPCRAPILEADRLVCSAPALAAQDLRMRATYARALAAGADRLEVDRGQARWRGARDRATDERRLAQLYTQRIDALEVAARHPRPPPRPFGG